MSAWVAPSVAAEMWGISVDEVLAGIADGSIQSYVDGQFLFVDLGRNSFPKTMPRESKPGPVVTQEELAALTFQPVERSPDSLPLESMPVDDETLQVTDDDFHDVTNWRTAREQTSRLRRPPTADAA
jgi:hypothetical protein